MARSTDPAINPFTHLTRSAEAPALDAAAVTPSNGSDLPAYAKALRIYNPGTGAATLRVTYAGQDNDAVVVDLTVPPGLTIEPSSVRRVWATGTTPGLSIHAYTR